MTGRTQSVQEELRRRAALLAAIPVKSEQANEQLEVMPFQLASECYAVELGCIREIWPLTSILPIPHTPSFVAGVTNVHGEIRSVIDLKQFFSLPSAGLTNLNKLIILEDEQMCFGILADEVLGSITVAKTELSPVDSWNGIDSRYITGVTRDRLIVLDGRKLLTDKRLVVNETTET